LSWFEEQDVLPGVLEARLLLKLGNFSVEDFRRIPMFQI
jgi:hypothetical protein